MLMYDTTILYTVQYLSTGTSTLYSGTHRCDVAYQCCTHTSEYVTDPCALAESTVRVDSLSRYSAKLTRTPYSVT